MALPSVVPLASLPPSLASPNTSIVTFDRHWIDAEDCPEQLLIRNGLPFRVHVLGDIDGKGICVVLPLDVLFDVRLTAARRLSLALRDRKPGPDQAALTQSQRNQLTDALRALDGRLDRATYREIAVALFDAARLPERGWKTHDLRDRTIRLSRLGFELMQGGYRQLLLYPYRQRLF